MDEIPVGARVLMMFFCIVLHDMDGPVLIYDDPWDMYKLYMSVNE